MKKVLVFAAILCLAASSAFAYDHLITNDKAPVQEAGTMKGEAAIGFLTASEAFDADSEAGDLGDDATALYIPLKFRYGLMDGLEVFGVLPFEKWDMGDAGESGIGDLFVGVKYGLMPEGMLTLRGALDIPLGDDEKGLGETGGFGIDVAAMTQKEMDLITLDGQVGLRYNVEDSDTKIQPGLGIYVDGEAAYALSDMFDVQGGLEIVFVGDSKWDGNDIDDSGMNWIELNLGGCYKMDDNIGIKGDILYTLMGKNTNKNMGVLISLMYGF